MMHVTITRIILQKIAIGMQLASSTIRCQTGRSETNATAVPNAHRTMRLRIPLHASATTIDPFTALWVYSISDSLRSIDKFGHKLSSEYAIDAANSRNGCVSRK